MTTQVLKTVKNVLTLSGLVVQTLQGGIQGPPGPPVPAGSDKQVFFSDGGNAGFDSGFTYDKIGGVLTLSGKTVTASTPALQVSQTWNNAAVAFTAAKINALDTASAAGSLVLDLQHNSTSVWKVDKGGNVTAAGTITASVAIAAPQGLIAPTWNNSGTAFTALQVNATDTASASGSLLLDLQKGSTSKLNVRKDGVLFLPGGDANAFKIVFGGTQNNATVGLQATGTLLQVSLADNSSWASLAVQDMTAHGQLTSLNNTTLAGGSLFINSSTGDHSVWGPGFIGWAPVANSTPSASNPALTRLYRDADHVVAQRSGTNAQEDRLYRTFTDVNNYVRAYRRWSGNDLLLGVEAAGTGTAGDFYIDSVRLKGAGWGLGSSFSLGAAASVTGTGATALGATSAAGSSCTAVGASANAGGTTSIAIGASSSVTVGQGAIAIGVGAAATGGNGAIALGDGATADLSQILAVGSSSSSSFAITDAYFGSSRVSTAPVSFTLHASGGSGTDIAGANITIAGGQPTGAGAGGNVYFATAAAGATGTALRALVSRWFIGSLGSLYPFADNVYDIGNGTNRVGSIYAGTSLVSPFANLTNTVQATERLRLSGQEFYQAASTDTNGPTLLLGVNRSGNRQLWIADSAALTQNTTNPTFVVHVQGGTGINLFARATDGVTALPLTVGGQTVNVQCAGVTTWAFTSNGHFYPQATATYDIGGPANQARNQYLSGNSYHYASFLDASNYARLRVGSSGNLQIASEGAGTVPAVDMFFLVGGATRLGLLAAGNTQVYTNFVFSADNSFDIGASAANRPRTGYFGTSVVSTQFDGPLGSRTGNLTRINQPAGAGAYFSAGQTGAIKITLPSPMFSTMLKFRVTLFDYNAVTTSQAGKSRVFEISGYDNTAPNWYNCKVDQISGPETPVNVRFGIDSGGFACVWIGDTNTTWNFMAVQVTELQAHFSNDAVTTWEKGWAISLDTTMTGATITNTTLSHSSANNQGTFNPTIMFGGTSVGLTYSSQQGKYTKQGNVVTFSIYVRPSAMGTSTGQCTIGGLPFACNSAVSFTSVSIVMNGGVAITGAPQAYIPANAQTITLGQGLGTITVLTDANVQAGTEFLITGSYLVA